MSEKACVFKITYAGLENIIWRIAAVSSECTLEQLGSLILSTFDALGCHSFEMCFKNLHLFLHRNDYEDLPHSENEVCDLLCNFTIGRTDMKIGDTIKMIYDLNCKQLFNLELLEINDIAEARIGDCPRIIDGAGCGIIDNMPASKLLEVIKKIDETGHSEIYYSGHEIDNPPEWDYRNYSVNDDNDFLKRKLSV